MITPQQQQQIQATLRNSGIAPAVGMAPWYQELKGTNTTVDQQNAPQTPSVLSDYGDQISSATHKITSSVGNAADNLAADNASGDNSLLGEFKKAGHLVEGGLGAAAGAAQAIFAPFSAAFQKIADDTGVHPVQTFMQSPQGQAFVNWAKAHPELATNLGDALTVATSDAGDAGLGKLAPIAKDIASDTTSTVKDAAAAVSDKLHPTPPSPEDAAAAQLERNQAAQQAIKDEITKTAGKYPSTVGSTLDTMVRQNGTDPLGVISSYGKDALPTVNEGGKLDTLEQQAFLKNRIGDLSDVKNDAVFINDNSVPLDGVKKYAADLVDAQKSWTQARKAKALDQIGKEFDSFAAAYKDAPLSTAELDKIKTEQTGLSKAYNNSGAKPFELDTHGIIGKAARDLVELHTDDAPTKELNKLIQSHYDAVDLLDALNGKAPHGGYLTRTLNRMAGEITGAVAGGSIGHPFIGAMAGRAGADLISGILNSNFISSPLKRRLIEGMTTIEPKVKQKMLDYIEQNAPAIGDLGEQPTVPQAATSGPVPAAPTQMGTYKP
jgi:hypothetical protein